MIKILWKKRKFFHELDEDSWVNKDMNKGNPNLKILN